MGDLSEGRLNLNLQNLGIAGIGNINYHRLQVSDSLTTEDRRYAQRSQSMCTPCNSVPNSVYSVVKKLMYSQLLNFLNKKAADSFGCFRYNGHFAG
jgi:hypothetical protein